MTGAGVEAGFATGAGAAEAGDADAVGAEGAAFGGAATAFIVSANTATLETWATRRA